MRKTGDIITGVDEKAVDVLLEFSSLVREDILFIDIETTGLSPKNSILYLIGTGFYRDGKWQICQFFSESDIHEEEVLSAFSDFSRNFKMVVHFNGDRFDIPYLQARYQEHKLSDPFANLTSLDLYKIVKPLKQQLGLSDCKQKTIELFLGIEREDKYDGGKLIPVYNKFVETEDKTLLNLLLLHNNDDVKGMMKLLPILYFHAFFSMFRNMPGVSVRTDEEIDESRYIESLKNNTTEEINDILSKLPIRAKKVQANYYKDFDGTDKKEIYMKLSLALELPAPISGNVDGCFFKAYKSEATIKVPLYEEELRYFYSNYKDYYYLPHEDMAIHKSIAAFVDKDYREKARPDNCYTKREGQYLKEWDMVFAPFFKRDYNDKNFYFDLNENMKKSRFAMSLYACHVVCHILNL